MDIKEFSAMLNSSPYTVVGAEDLRYTFSQTGTLTITGKNPFTLVHYEVY
jgi:hypothetical protein